MPSPSLIRADFVHCPQLGVVEIAHDHLLEVDADGFITHFAPASSSKSSQLLQHSTAAAAGLTVVPSGSFVLPTFCDLHLHAPQFLYQGTGLDLPLMQWLDEYAYRSEERLDGDPSLAQRVYTRLARRLLENGTGAVLLFGTIKTETNLILAKAMHAAGLRAFVGKLSMDISSRPTYVEPSASAALAAAQTFIRSCRELSAHLPANRRLVQPVLTPRFVPTCSDALLESLGKVSEEEDVRVQSHMSEAHDQVAWVEQERGVSDVQVFTRSNLLTARTVQAHCTFLPPATLADLAARGTSIAHCPLSNAYFSARPFALREALDAGVQIGLGTDIAGGYSADVMSAMRHAVSVARMREGERLVQGAQGSRVVNWKEALYLATLGGAKALGLPEGTGMFVVGAPFDAQLVRLYDPQNGEGVGNLDFFDLEQQDGGPEGASLTEEMVEKWWCVGDVRNRAGVWVQGREVYNNKTS